MVTRLWPVALAFVLQLWALSLSTVQAQTVEEDDTQVLRAVAAPLEPANRPNLTEALKRVRALTNAFREDQGRRKVTINPELAKAAQYFAEFMARTSRYGHKADGSTPAGRAEKFGYAYCIIAENLAYTYNSDGFTADDLAKEIVDGWKASPGHRKNMLDPDVTEAGMALAQAPDGGYIFAVQLYGRPRSKALEFEITNRSLTTVEYSMGDRPFKLEPGHVRSHQVCRPRDLKFRWQDSQGEARLVQPKNGDRIVITEKSGALELNVDQSSR